MSLVMGGMDKRDMIWLEVKLAADNVSARVSSILGDLKVITLWEDQIATAGPRNVVAVSGDAIRLAEFSRDAIEGILAQEAAHLCIRQQPRKQQIADEEEREADQMAVEWGFREKLCAFFKEYEKNRERLGWMRIRDPPGDCAKM